MPRGMLEFWLDQKVHIIKEIAPEKTKVLYCASNWRSALAKINSGHGFDNVCHAWVDFKQLKMKVLKSRVLNSYFLASR